MYLNWKLDKIIKILYDGDSLHWKEVSMIDITEYAKEKFGIEWTDEQINFVMDILVNEGYVRINQSSNPTYSLTIKGIQFRNKGGFVITHLMEIAKQVLILLGIILTIILGFIQVHDYLYRVK